ncbi:hypothetical protein RCL_jg18016.t1 [Rhizophagus clarus]|uniref:Uncharacterized protein n=1 Tax=Rhizophagus clarus TaxID=94130 RepID=A0A8H3L8Q2_9GLOM|nr:hypothetical protein RCL_jg18016.t1 [Rhizophagus clarus]
MDYDSSSQNSDNYQSFQTEQHFQLRRLRRLSFRKRYSATTHVLFCAFQVSGYKIIIIPNSSPYSSLYENFDNLDIHNNQSQQVFTSLIDNSQTQFQQNSNESFTILLANLLI